MSAQKNSPNIALKVAIVTKGKRQREIAVRSRISEERLSQIVTGRRSPTKAERKALARALDCHVDVLFPESVAS